jgi:uncharacterized protein YlxW (UPF0749 family)|tara:strand:- start:1554 stop:1862 length:309 start_codon:yes stop_codon:yes gene_type:complete
MDNATITAIVTCVVGGLLSAGGWKFYETVLKQRSERRKEESITRTAYRDDLIKRVDKLEKERENLTAALIMLKTDISAMKVELEYVKRENNVLKLKIDAQRI